MAPSVSTPFTPSPIYTLFFLYIEPLSALVGAYYAHYQPKAYLDMTYTSAASPNPTLANIPPATIITLSQLANLYLLFALNEALVLRSTNDLKVWRTLLFGLLIADIGHLWSVRPLLGLPSLSDGLLVNGGFYWKFWEWNAMHWGNVGFVYVGASMRIAFLLGIGVEKRVGGKTKRR